MNNKGFTMIELLASMVLLSILMLTAVPTVLGVMDDSRKTTILNDSKKFVANVEYKLKHNNNYIKKPRSVVKEQGNFTMKAARKSNGCNIFATAPILFRA